MRLGDNSSTVCLRMDYNAQSPNSLCKLLLCSPFASLYRKNGVLTPNNQRYCDQAKDARKSKNIVVGYIYTYIWAKNILFASWLFLTDTLRVWKQRPNCGFMGGMLRPKPQIARSLVVNLFDSLPGMIHA